MKKTNVSIVLRVRNADGTRAHYTAVSGANGRLKPLVGLVQGKPQHLPTGTYYLRYAKPNGNGTKRVWEAVGNDPALALTAMHRRVHQLDGIKIGLTQNPNGVAGVSPTGIGFPSFSGRLELRRAIEAYVAFIPDKLSDPSSESGSGIHTLKALETARKYRVRLLEFANSCGKDIASDLTEVDVCRYILMLRGLMKKSKTIINRLTVLRSFLRWANLNHHIVTAAAVRLRLKLKKHKAHTYETGQLNRLMAASSERDRLVWSIFLKTGLRDQELSYLAWDDISFDTGIITLREKPDVGFTIKDREERMIPVPTDLLAELKELRLKNRESRWVITTKFGGPDRHFLRILKRTAFRAGLNCGYCVSKSPGKTCKTHPVCNRWQIHSFRRTTATMWNRNEIDPRTIQELLGHSDLSTTLKYLASENLQTEEFRRKIDGAFAAVKKCA